MVSPADASVRDTWAIIASHIQIPLAEVWLRVVVTLCSPRTGALDELPTRHRFWLPTESVGRHRGRQGPARLGTLPCAEMFAHRE